MADIRTTGIAPRDLTGYLERLEAVMRDALGQTVNLAQETPQGQLVGILALVFAEVDELAVYVANGLNPDTATGRQLDDIGALFGIGRIIGERSTVTATLTGASGTIVPAGTRARTMEGAGFALASDALIPVGGSVDALFRSVVVGPILAGAGALDEIVDVIPGWTAVSNALAAEPGRATEIDSEYRQRYRGEVTIHARDGIDGIRARVLGASGVTYCIVRDNATTAEVTIQGVAIPAGAFIVIVQGGATADIAKAIADTKPVGISSTGSVAVNVPIADGVTTPIRFSRVTSVDIAIALTIRPGNAFPSDGVARIRANLQEYVMAFDIAEAVDERRILAPITAVPGHEITAVAITHADNTAIEVPDLDERLALSSDNITITVTV